MRCKFFYDCEFLEGTQNKTVFGLRTPFKNNVPTIDLISIGMVSELGDSYYGISKEFNLKEAWYRQDADGSFWIRENVLLPIYNKLILLEPGLTTEPFSLSYLKDLIKDYGKTREQIAEDILMLVRTVQIKLNETLDPVQFFGYYSAYDHVALCWLFGKMIDLPIGFPMYTTDLKQIYDEINSKIPERNLNKYPDYPVQAQDTYHDALADARWNLELFKFLNTHK